MPRKLRQLIADLEKVGFVNRGGNGAGDDAKHYQERDVRQALKTVKE
jgi:hypothetical protein